MGGAPAPTPFSLHVFTLCLGGTSHGDCFGTGYHGALPQPDTGAVPHIASAVQHRLTRGLADENTIRHHSPHCYFQDGHKHVFIYIHLHYAERSALSGAFLHCFILFVLCLYYYICIAFLLIFVPLKEYYSASTPPLPQRQFPKFQFSKVPIFQKNQRNQKKQKKTIVPGLCLTPSSPHGLCRIVFFWFFWFLWFFWKIGILENWNFGFFYFLGCFKFSISLEVDNTTTFSQFQNSL